MVKVTIIDGNDEIELSTAPKENIKAYMVKGEPGSDGVSPTASISKTGDTATITVTDKNGTTEADVVDGFNPTVTASKSNRVTTLTITDIDGTRTAEILDGLDLTGGVPTNGVIGFDGVAADIPNGYEVTTEPFPGSTGGGIIGLKSITTVPSTFSEGDKYYNSTDDLIYTATSSSTWDNGETPNATSLYLNEADNKLYRYYNNTMNLEGGTGETLKIGTILPFSGTTAPTGYLICDGSAISRTTYSALFSVIGTTYGTGDGSTTFNLPNLKGKVPVGLDGSDSDFDNLGETGGEKSHILTTDEIPSHAHPYQGYKTSGMAFNGSAQYPGTAYASGASVVAMGGSTSSVGGGNAHNNLQPYIVVNYIIKASDVTPTQAQIVDGYSTSTTDGYSANYVNNVTQANITTDGSAVKCGFKVDNKDVYVKRINFGTLPNATSKSVATGIDFTNYTLYKIEGVAKFSTNNVAFAIPFAHPTNLGYAIMVNIDNSNNIVVNTGIDRSGYIGYFNIYYF